MVVPLMPHYGQLKTVPLGLFPTYCFDSQLPVLLSSHDFGTMNTDFHHIVKVANRYLPREILVFEDKRKILSANVETITNLDPTDPALTPPANNSSTSASTSSVPAPSTKLIQVVPIAGGVMVGMLLKKQVPFYPQEAMDAHISGTVVLQAIIGRDGGVHDLHVISAPAPSLAISALWAVSQWQYKPYMLNGEPTEVQTTVNVIFSMGG
jgi:TonB family protein